MGQPPGHSVYGQPTVTELRWEQNGREWIALSRIDFRLIFDLLRFETATTVYSWFLFFDQSTGDDPRKPSGVISPSARAQCVVLNATTEELQAHSLTLGILNYIHAYFDVYGQELAASFNRRQAESVQREREAQTPVTSKNGLL